jgi:hypothetical protein
MRLGTQTARALREGEAAKAELAAMTDELERLRAAASDGSASEYESQRRLEEQLERERAKRVEHIQYVAGKRIGNRSLALGWSKWHGDYAERARRSRVLKAAGAKLLRPKLVQSYGHWRRDWEIEVASNAKLTLVEQIEKAKKEAREKEAELLRLRGEMDEARMAMEEGRGAELMERKRVEERLEAERQKRIEHTQQMAVLRLSKRELTKGWLGWQTPYLERRRRMRLL